jgi:NAD(P)-dependent dehydrogenase (short-subunit alcohol dehydrogenase family)
MNTVALVTGGSRGIGFAIARALLQRDMHVAITGRDRAALDSAARALGPLDRVLATSADVGRLEDVERSISAVVSKWGRLDVLINNAGVGGFAHVADMPPELWRSVIDTNLTGVYYCCHAAIPHLRRAGGGWIINISSLAGKNAFVGGAAYCASKSALNAFSEALMQEVRYDGIRVSYIMPGSVATGFGFPSGAGAPGEDEWKIQPEDVARTVVDLIEQPKRTLSSRIEMRPSQPKKR